MRTLLLSLVVASSALAQTAATPIPQKHIPPNVLMELRALEGQFDLSLSRDCAPEKCVSKGCVYVDHSVVDRPVSTSLPGLGAPQPEGPGSVPPQEYLTQARCEFAHEKSVPQRDVDALIRRLEQRLSKGWLQVKVTRQILEPISPSLSESPPPKEPPAPKVEPPPPAPAPVPPQQWEAAVALRELWVTLLPHFWWMIALFLGSLTTLTVIWGLRRVGRESLEEKAMLAQLNAAPPPPAEVPAEAEKKDEGTAPAAVALPALEPEGLDPAQLAELTQHWRVRFDEADLEKDDGQVVELLRDWLKTRQFPLLAKALFTFGDRLSAALASDGELAPQKTAFAEYLRGLDPKQLPSDSVFFQTLDRHGKASSLTVQPDTRVFRSLSQEFGTTGLASLIARLPRAHGALVLALMPPDGQEEVARTLPEALRVELAEQLLRSNRVSKEERHQVFQALELARAGLPLSAAPKPSAHDVGDRGQPFDAAGALSVLLPLLPVPERKAVFAQALERTNEVLPAWYGDILFPEMLLALPDDVRADALLEIDARSLAGWLSTQRPELRERFVARLSPALQTAVRANGSFGSREERYESARRGREELVAVLGRFTSQGRIAPGAGLA